MNTIPLNTALKELGKHITKNAPSILTAVGIGLGLASTVLAVKATPKAVQLLEEKKDELGTDKLTVLETVKTAAVQYIPSVLAAAGGIYCVASANAKHNKRNAVLMAAYTVAERDLREYKHKVIETLGEKKERDIRGKIAKDKMDETPVEPEKICTPDGGKTLCFDKWSGRYFMSDMETLRKCENELNACVIRDQFVALNELYYMLGLDEVKLGNDFGWNYDADTHNDLIAFSYFSQLNENGSPCLVLDFDVEPYDIYQR